MVDWAVKTRFCTPPPTPNPLWPYAIDGALKCKTPPPPPLSRTHTHRKYILYLPPTPTPIQARACLCVCVCVCERERERERAREREESPSFCHFLWRQIVTGVVLFRLCFFPGKATRNAPRNNYLGTVKVFAKIPSGKFMPYRTILLQEVTLYCLRSGEYQVNARDNAGYTALHESCVKGSVRVARHLIVRGADVNCCSQDGIRWSLSWYQIQITGVGVEVKPLEGTVQWSVNEWVKWYCDGRMHVTGFTRREGAKKKRKTSRDRSRERGQTNILFCSFIFVFLLVLFFPLPLASSVFPPRLPCRPLLLPVCAPARLLRRPLLLPLPASCLLPPTRLPHRPPLSLPPSLSFCCFFTSASSSSASSSLFLLFHFLFLLSLCLLFISPPTVGRGCLMSPSCLESQGCRLIPLSYLLSCFCCCCCCLCLVLLLFLSCHFFLLMVHSPDFFPWKLSNIFR